MEKEFICILNSSHYCTNRASYNRNCKLDLTSGFAMSQCQYRLEATELAAAAEEESPENVAQQQQPKSADVMQAEIESVF